MTVSSSELKQSLDLLELKPGKLVSWKALGTLLPDVETALFFAKAYDLNYSKLSRMLERLFNSTVLGALQHGDHSLELQDYLVDTIPEDVFPQAKPSFVDAPPKAEILPYLWEQAETTIAQSIKDVALKLAGTLDLLPSKEGAMTFRHMAKLNKQRPTVGVFGAQIEHKRQAENLVILDVSGSMTAETVSNIISDVVALSWKANAHLAIVSNTCFHWEPGTYNVADVLRQAEFGGTHYEKLAPLMQRNWGTVVTIADYDSSYGAKQALAESTGRIGQVLDISLVNQPTFLAECVGQLADEVKPLLIAQSHVVLI